MLRGIWGLGIVMILAAPCGAAERAAGHPKPSHRAAPTPRSTPSAADRYRSDLLHGSAAQQNLERSDNELAHTRPIDHAKDDFFSDWKGIK